LIRIMAVDVQELKGVNFPIPATFRKGGAMKTGEPARIAEMI
jgi:hypothetical protein